MNKLSITILFLIIIMLISNSCNFDRSTKTVNISIIQDNSCIPPCWFQITPGLSTRDEVKNLLPTVPFIDIDSIKETSVFEPNDSIEWNWDSNAANSSGRIFFKGNIVTLISIYFEGTIKFNDLINILGKPESILAVNFIGAERNRMQIDILSQSKGYGFGITYWTMFPQNPIQINGKEEAEYLWYCEPINCLETLYGSIGYNFESIIDQGLQEWTGFGEYQYIFWDPSLHNEEIESLDEY